MLRTYDDYRFRDPATLPSVGCDLTAITKSGMGCHDSPYMLRRSDSRLLVELFEHLPELFRFSRIESAGQGSAARSIPRIDSRGVRCQKRTCRRDATEGHDTDRFAAQANHRRGGFEQCMHRFAWIESDSHALAAQRHNSPLVGLSTCKITIVQHLLEFT